MEVFSQADVRIARLSLIRAELASLGAQFVDMRRDLAEAVKGAAKRRDGWLVEHTRKEHLG